MTKQELRRIIKEELQKANGGLKQAIADAIPDNTSVQDFATAVAQILQEDYGTHNYAQFIQVLQKHISHD